ncbi:rho-related BTB domain-containing protein 2-like [Mytilus galloprovincialis]|uniref:rho-related BTB domain-containing protein 2-like n=1 Tax=Mytilus galloprovincialis TaxID=29158 RepID=UPI003F7B3BE9
MVQTANLPKDNYEFVKCVVVGDGGVGKTCLTCAWSVGTTYKLESLVKSHVSTVFAIDHFIKDKQVSDRSWCNVDGVPVCLHLWDTFGYHDKDRGFAYKGADVVLLCFSVVKPSSLDSVIRFWVSEIKSKSSTTPIVLVGTQADMRYNCYDDGYKAMDKGLVYKEVKPEHVILPEKGRTVAKQIGAPYYETSVLTHHGVDDVFFNVIRAAMIERRKIKFWSPQLRRIKYPLIQKPMEWPMRLFPEIKIPESTINEELAEIHTRQNVGDLLVSVRDVCFTAHRVILASSCQIIEEILMADYCSHDNSTVKTSETTQQTAFCHDIKLPGFETIEYKQCQDPFNRMHGEMITVLTIAREVTPLAFQYVLEYLYTGTAKEDFDILPEAKKAAELLQLKDLLLQISNLQSNETFLNSKLQKQFRHDRCDALNRIAIHKGAFTDVKFSLDDDVVSAHKPLLMARCDMMAAMFTANFMEASAPVIPLPGVTADVFKVLQEFLYTGCVTNVMDVDCLALIEVANRFCLPRFVKLIENAIVEQFLMWDDQKVSILEDVILLIEPSHLHNAYQLAAWCLEYVCQHYPEAWKYNKHYMQALSKDNLKFLEKNRWPPAWYVNEYELYNNAINEDSKKRLIQRQAQFTRLQRCTTACLCFRRPSRFSFEDTDIEEVQG